MCEEGGTGDLFGSQLMLDKLPKDPAGKITTAGIKARPSSEEMKGAPCADNHRVDLHSKLQTVLTGIRRLTVRAVGGGGVPKVGF